MPVNTGSFIWLFFEQATNSMKCSRPITGVSVQHSIVHKALLTRHHSLPYSIRILPPCEEEPAAKEMQLCSSFLLPGGVQKNSSPRPRQSFFRPKSKHSFVRKISLELVAISCHRNETRDWVNNGDCVRGSNRIGAPNICWRGPGTNAGPASVYRWL